MAADNLAAHEVGWFQETFSSKHFCRRCLISYNNRQISLTDLEIIPRTQDIHDQHLQLEGIDGVTLAMMDSHDSVKLVMPRFKDQLLFINKQRGLFEKENNEYNSSSKTTASFVKTFFSLTTTVEQNDLLKPEDDNVELSHQLSLTVPSATTSEFNIKKEFTDIIEILFLTTWKQSLISKMKRARQAKTSNEEVVVMKNKYSKPNSGRHLKEPNISDLCERTDEKKMIVQPVQESEVEDFEKLVDSMNQELVKNPAGNDIIKDLWRKTYKYRRHYIQTNKTVDILLKFPAYRLMNLLFADVQMLIGVSVEKAANEKLPDLLVSLVENEASTQISTADTVNVSNESTNEEKSDSALITPPGTPKNKRKHLQDVDDHSLLPKKIKVVPSNKVLSTAAAGCSTKRKRDTIKTSENLQAVMDDEDYSLHQIKKSRRQKDQRKRK
ncbi:unnamed protein product [Didymodactylos carnosus]|uniref:Uncharacterized protein n=1 Tax=Didymodactylos carnosus TaxID=1234261 RepID=A0A815C622_9BILA|nr:unnamed protein product [Didymodactylos carnosus]CAF4072133.1 unnamed protein product [Didymodactylos carnosus]